MLKIRFQRMGRKREYSYRLVVTEKNDPVQGKFVERLGQYNPSRKKDSLYFKKDRIEYWISVGARPSETVARLLAKNGVDNMEVFFNKHEHKKRKKGAPEEEAKAETSAETKSEESAEEKKE